MNISELPFYIFCLFMCFQLFIFLRYIPAIFSKKKAQHTEPIPTSVIICAHNEKENLQKHLPLILNQEHPEFEVIVVDDRSHDESYDWLMEQKSKNKHLKVLRIDEVPAHINNKKYALSLGIKAAKHEWLVFTDADCYPTSTQWVDKMSSINADGTEIALGVSLYEKKKGFLNQFIRFETYQTAALYVAKALKGAAYMGVGRNLAYSKSLFIKNKGFNKIAAITGGDDDLFVNKYAVKGNHIVILQPEAINFSIPESSWSALIKQKKRHLSVGKYYKLKDKLFLSAIQLSTIFIWLMGAYLLISGSFTVQMVVLISLILRWVGQYVVYFKLSIKFGDNFKPWLLPILELYYMFMYIILGSIAIRSKRIQWK